MSRLQPDSSRPEKPSADAAPETLEMSQGREAREVPETGESQEAVEGPRVLPVLEETLEISRERDITGTVRVRKAVHHDQVQVPTRSVRETVETEGVAVNKPVEAMAPPWQTDDALVFPVYEERLVRQLFLVEELHVRRRRETIDETGTADLRREEIVVERLDPETQTWVRQDLAPGV